MLLDFVWSNIPLKIRVRDVLHAYEVNNHGALYIFSNGCVKNIPKIYNYIRNLLNLFINKFIKYCLNVRIVSVECRIRMHQSNVPKLQRLLRHGC